MLKAILAYGENKRPFMQLIKQEFALISQEAINHLAVFTISNGFILYAIFPWNENVIDNSKYLVKQKIKKPTVALKELI